MPLTEDQLVTPISLKTARAAIAAAWPELEIKFIKYLGGGSFSVFNVNHNYIFKFPKVDKEMGPIMTTKDYLNSFKRESKIYEFLKQQVKPHIIAKPVKKLAASQIFNYPIFVYDYLPGKSVADLKLNNQQKIKLAKLLADFLSKLHNIKLNKLEKFDFKIINNQKIRASWFKNYLDIKKNLFKFLSDSEKDFTNKIYQDFLSQAEQIEPKVSLAHGDFDPTNVLWDGQNNFLKVIDFESLEIGLPAGDFCIWWGEYGDDFLQIILNSYQAKLEPEIKKIIKFYYLRIPLIYFDLYQKSKNKKFLKFAKQKFKTRFKLLNHH